MTWPTVAVDTTDTDSGTDSPATARADLLDALQRLNQIIAHVSASGAGLLDDADYAAMRSTLGLGTLATQNGTFSGTSSGTNTGDQTNVAGSSGSCTGNAATATALQTARAINGVNFDGSADITVPAAAGTLTGDLATGQAQDMGSGTGNATLVGVAHINTTVVGNVGAGPDDLMTYSLPGNSLSSNAKGIRVTAWGVVANNANAKTIASIWGTAVTGFALTPSQSSFWRMIMTVIRTGSGAQDRTIVLEEMPSTGVLATPKKAMVLESTSQTDTGAITVGVSAYVVTSTDDITQEGMIVEFFN